MVELCFDKKKVNTEEELLDILQDNLIRVNDSIMLTHKGKRINIKLNQTIEADKQDSLWYGGTCATLKCKNFTFTLGARGDVECSLFDKDGNCLESVKDRRNGGGFYELSHYLHSDEDVRNAEQEEGPYSLEFRHNNWWECWIDTTDKKFNENYDDFWNVEESYFYRALADCIYVLCEHAVKKKGE